MRLNDVKANAAASHNQGIIFAKKMCQKNWKIRRGGLLIFIIAITISLAGCGQSGAPRPSQSASPTTAGQTDKAAGNTQTQGSGAGISTNNGGGGTSTGANGHGSAGLPADSMLSASQLDQGIKKHKTWQIIDVREPSEFAAGHVPGARNIPLGKLAEDLGQIPKDKEIILVDLNGTRSYTAWQTLKDKGYNAGELKVLVGGMEQWNSLGSGEITESIGGC